MSVNEVTEIFVRLVDEEIDVWRPVEARHLRESIYTIVDQPYDRDLEVWEFGPGQDVVCAMIDAFEGPILAAISLLES